jgi:hypothetical protein
MNPKKLFLLTVLALACAALLAGPAAAAKPGGSHKLRIESIAVGSKTGPLTIRVRAGVHANLTIWVRGHRVDHPFEFAGPQTQSIALRAADRLHPGADRIRIRARHRGRVLEARRTVHVPAWALLADAGADNGSVVRAKAQVGTAGAVGGGTDLDYRWHIAKRPQGGRVKLIGRDGPQPMVDATTPGTYVLQLKVDQGGEGPDSFDQVTVAVNPDDPPIGAPINTLDANNAIAIAGKSYGGGATCQCTSYVVLERTTRVVVEDGRVANDASGIAKLAGFADHYGSDDKYMKYLMVLSGPSGVPHAQIDDFARLLKKIGATLPAPEAFAALDNQNPLPYSAIGIPGAPAGAATTRIPGVSDSPVSGAMVGYLQKNQAVSGDGTPLYDYVAPEHPSFDTRAESTAKKNTMSVGGATYSASLADNVTAGLHVVALDGLTLRMLYNVAIPTNTGNAAGDRALQKTAAEEIAKAAGKPAGPLVLVQTIGKPKGAGPEWGAVVNQLARLGANPQLVNALDGTNEFALVSRVGAEEPPAEASTAYESAYPNPNYPRSRLAGVLARNRTSNFVPNVSGTPTPNNESGVVNTALVETAYQPAKAWPPLSTQGTDAEIVAVQSYICTALNFCKPANSCAQIRECFWQKYSAEWGDKRTTLLGLNYSPTQDFKEGVFQEAKTELLKEISSVVNVEGWIRRLQEPLDRSSLRSYVDLQDIGNKVFNAVQPDPSSNSTSWILGLVGKAVALGGFGKPPLSSAAAGFSAAFGLLSYLTNKQGQPLLGTEIKVRSSALAGEMLDRVELARRAMTGIGMLLVSDYGKLEKANGEIDSNWTLPDTEVLSTQLRNATRQWFWEALLPTAYPYLIQSVAPSAGAIDCAIPDRRAWPNQPESFQSRATVGYREDGTPIRGVFFFTRGIGGGSSPDARKLDDEPFRPLDGTKPGVGLEKLRFFSSRVWGRTIHAVNGARGCKVKWLPNLW